jgi:hypothetical protein
MYPIAKGRTYNLPFCESPPWVMDHNLWRRFTRCKSKVVVPKCGVIIPFIVALEQRTTYYWCRSSSLMHFWWGSFWYRVLLLGLLGNFKIQLGLDFSCWEQVIATFMGAATVAKLTIKTERRSTRVPSPKLLEVNPCNLNRWEHRSLDLSLHTYFN